MIKASTRGRRETCFIPVWSGDKLDSPGDIEKAKQARTLYKDLGPRTDVEDEGRRRRWKGTKASGPFRPNRGRMLVLPYRDKRHH
jgi:hypothetical protein